MTESLPPCPECPSEHTFEPGALLVCPEGAHEWEAAPAEQAAEPVVKDAAGNVLADGDPVIGTKNLRVKGRRHVRQGGAPRSATSAWSTAWRAWRVCRAWTVTTSGDRR